MRALLVLGCLYMITGILGLLYITDKGVLELIHRKSKGEEVPEWLYQRISRFEHFLAAYTTPAMVGMVVVLVPVIFVIDTLPKAAWRLIGRLIHNHASVLF